MNDQNLTICQCCECLATMIDDKELLKTIDYIEERATAMYNKLVERKAQVERLEKALHNACEILEEYGALNNIYAEDKRTLEQWKEYLLNGIE